MTWSPNLIWFIVAALAALAVGSVVRIGLLRGKARESARSRLDSLKTWWLVAIAVVAAVLAGRIGVTVLMSVTSWLAFCEFARMARIRTNSLSLFVVSLLLIVFNYVWVAAVLPAIYAVFLPLAGLLLLTTEAVRRGEVQGFTRATSGEFWGMMLTVYCLGHAALLYTLPESTNPTAGVAGWFLYLVVVTECSDIFQAWIGRRFGKHAMCPVISPKKTWEGLIGGQLLTLVLAVVLAPLLTAFATGSVLSWQALVAGIVIGSSGVIGDLTMSCVKRDIGIKDSSTLLPGQGGILDRIDSLTFSAPCFYYFLLWVV